MHGSRFIAGLSLARDKPRPVVQAVQATRRRDVAAGVPLSVWIRERLRVVATRELKALGREPPWQAQKQEGPTSYAVTIWDFLTPQVWARFKTPGFRVT